MEPTAPSGADVGSGASPAPRAALRALLVDGNRTPDLNEARLRESLVAGLAEDDPQVRTTCSWALTMLSDEQPGAIPGVVRAIIDRFAGHAGGRRPADDRGPNLPDDVRTVLAKLDDVHPGRVRPVLADSGIDPARLSTGDNRRRAPVRSNSGAGSSAIDDLRQVVSTSGEMPVVHVDDTPISDRTGGKQSNRDGDHRRDDRSDSPSELESASTDDDDGHDASDARDARETGSRKAAQKRREIGRIEQSETFQTIERMIRFDELEIVHPKDGGRYADMIRVRAQADGDERGVALGLFERPDEDTGKFADDLAARLARWQGASQASGVVTVYDWAKEPRPWLASEPVGETLAEWDVPDVGSRLRVGTQLADTVAGCHRQGVIHAGIDPGNIVFPTHVLDEEPQPMLDNVGLMLAFRDHFEPAEFLDPRYAAPEYFDRGFGGIDQSTDVYGLGASLYHLFTGRAPFRGTYDEVRHGILNDDPDPPTEHNAALPDPVDEVIAKALAKQKLVRYETARQLRRDLLGICERSGFSVQ